MKNNNLSATAIPDFVYTANATLEEIGDSPLYTLTLQRLEPIFKMVLGTKPATGTVDSPAGAGEVFNSKRRLGHLTDQSANA